MQRRVLALVAVGALVAGSLGVQGVSAAAKPTKATQMAMSTGMWTWETINMYALPSRRVVGSVSFTWSWKTGMSTARLSLMGMAPGSIHPAHIHLGRCGSNGPVLVPFPSVHIGMNGMGTTMAMFRGGFAHKNWYVNVHAGPGLATMMQAMPVACGNVL